MAFCSSDASMSRFLANGCMLLTFRSFFESTVSISASSLSFWYGIHSLLGEKKHQGCSSGMAVKR